jgi:hypothetical protein
MSHCTSNSSQSFGVSNDNDGQPLWERFVSKYRNISMVLSGHVTDLDGTGRRDDLGDNGNIVHQMLSDYQAYPNGGNGYLRILTFRPASNRIDVQTYSPYLNQYLTDSHHQFSLMWHYTGALPATGTIAGHVESALNCSPMAGVTISSPGGSTTTDANGNYSLSASSPSLTPVTASLGGWLPVTQNTTVLQGASPAPGKFLMSTAGKVQGRVVDSSGAAMSNASVFFSGGVVQTRLTVTTDANGNYSTGWMTVGSYQVTASANGTQGFANTTVSSGASTTLNITLAGTAPPPAPVAGVTVTSPGDGATVNSPVNFVASATAPSGRTISALRIYVDNNSMYTVNANSLNTSLALASGTHNVIIQAWDNTGAVYKAPLTITVSAPAPPPSPTAGVTVSSPADGATVSSPANFVANATAPVGRIISALRLYVDDNSMYTVNASSLNTSLALASGTHNVIIQAWDNTGAVYKAPLTITVSAPAPPPTAGVSVSSPVPNSSDNSPVHVVATAAAPLGRAITAMRIYLDYTGVYTVNAASMDTYVTMASGSHNLIVQAWDSAGTVYKQSMGVQVP